MIFKSATILLTGVLGVFAAGIAEASTVTVFYSFDASYYKNCDTDCNDPDFGNFEVQLSYQNVVQENLPDFDTSDNLRSIDIRYGGETTVRVASPIGSIAFQAIGRGGSIVDVFEGNSSSNAILLPGESVSSVLKPDRNFFWLGGVVAFYGENVISLGRNGIFSFTKSNIIDFDGDDIVGDFRFENVNGDFITPEISTYIVRDVQISISPVPLPATAPLLIIGLTLLGLRVRKFSQPMTRSQDR